jgi:hypothetical protein
MLEAIVENGNVAASDIGPFREIGGELVTFFREKSDDDIKSALIRLWQQKKLPYDVRNGLAKSFDWRGSAAAVAVEARSLWRETYLRNAI